VSNFVKISQTTAKIWRFFDVLEMAAAAILDVQNVKLLMVGRLKRVEVRRHAKFGRNRRTAAEILQFFDFSRWLPLPSWFTFLKF